MTKKLTSFRKLAGTPVLRMRDSWLGELYPDQYDESQSRAYAMRELSSAGNGQHVRG